MKAHIFIDAENVRPEIGIRAVKKFCRDYAVECVGKKGVKLQKQFTKILKTM